MPVFDLAFRVHSTQQGARLASWTRRAFGVSSGRRTLSTTLSTLASRSVVRSGTPPAIVPSLQRLGARRIVSPRVHSEASKTLGALGTVAEVGRRRPDGRPDGIQAGAMDSFPKWLLIARASGFGRVGRGPAGRGAGGMAGAADVTAGGGRQSGGPCSGGRASPRAAVGAAAVESLNGGCGCVGGCVGAFVGVRTNRGGCVVAAMAGAPSAVTRRRLESE